jgi:4a-hydroxytetrahydrobiopterin dehydratase
MSQRRPVDTQEIEAFLADHPGWSAQDGRLRRQFRFPSFVTAFGFMASVALIAERMDHHPEWTNVYSKVDVVLSTHDVGAITADDLALAAAMDGLAAHLPRPGHAS